MGQAKKRGTFEQRQAEAWEREHKALREQEAKNREHRNARKKGQRTGRTTRAALLAAITLALTSGKN